VQALKKTVLSELAARGGEIQSAALSKYAPVTRGSWRQPLLIENQTAYDESPYLNSVSADFFKTYGAPVVLGREFDQSDTADSPRVAIINESFARRYFPNQSPLGKWAAFPHQELTRYRIIGVVKDIRYENLRQDVPRTLYFLSAQVPPGDSHTFAIRTHTHVSSLAPAIQTLLTNVHPLLRLQDMHSLEDHIARSLLVERMLSMLAGFLGAMALLLSAIGIYGVMAYNVARRRKEIGIRIALGATRVSVIGMVVRQTIKLTLAGCFIGGAASLALSRVAEGFLFGIRPTDPLTFIGAMATLLFVAIVAAYLPGRRASRCSPVETLRNG
jgi:predicted permease